MRILNLTQHIGTAEQVAAGVYEPRDKSTVQAALTIDSLPSRRDISAIADEVVAEALASSPKPHAALIGGAPWLMAALEQELLLVGILPVYSFSTRESVEEIQADGTVIKRAVFRHQGFVLGASADALMAGCDWGGLQRIAEELVTAGLARCEETLARKRSREVAENAAALVARSLQ